MNSGEWIIWAVIGLVFGSRIGLTAGGLSGVLKSDRTPDAALWVVLFGVLGALFGGWVWVVVSGDGPASFLGAAIFGLLGAIAIQYFLLYQGRRHRHS
jgi:hypothetical protein